MRPFVFTLCVLSALWVAVPVYAQEEARVLILQPPVWVERNGDLVALHQDRPITAGDTLVTGETGRLLLGLPDGSDLKLGSNTRLAISTLREIHDSATSLSLMGSRELIEGAFVIPQGAFRYTTRASGEELHRALSINLGLIRIGVRGTDFLGVATTEADRVLMLEGGLIIEKNRYPAVRLSREMTSYVAPHNGAPKPVEIVDAVQSRGILELVEMLPDAVTLTPDGLWGVYLGAFGARENAEGLKRRMSNRGYPAEVLQAGPDDSLFHVVVAGFEERADAQGFIEFANTDLGVAGAHLKTPDSEPPQDQVELAAVEETEITIDITPAPTEATGLWGVYIGTFGTLDNADELMNEVNAKGFPAEVIQNGPEDPFYHVVIPGFSTREAALGFIDVAGAELGISGAHLKRPD